MVFGGITSALFGEEGDTIQQPTTFETLPAFGQDLFTDITQIGRNLVDAGIFNPVPLAPAQQQAAATLGAGAQFAPAVFRPQFNFGQRASTALSSVSPIIQEALGFGRAGATPITGEEISTGINQFFNPFIENVVDTSTRDILDQQAREAARIGSLASNLGAFGGTRQALLESELGGQTAEAIGDVSGRLRAQGFESASTKALQNLLSGRQRQLQAGQLGLGAAGQQTALGNSLLNARLGIESIKRGKLPQLAQAGQAALTGGQILRGFEQEQQGAPLRELQLLQSIASAIPRGGGQISQIAGTQGLLGSGGNIGAGLLGLATLPQIGNLSGFQFGLGGFGGIPFGGFA